MHLLIRFRDGIRFTTASRHFGLELENEDSNVFCEVPQKRKQSNSSATRLYVRCFASSHNTPVVLGLGLSNVFDSVRHCM